MQDPSLPASHLDRSSLGFYNIYEAFCAADGGCVDACGRLPPEVI